MKKIGKYTIRGLLGRGGMARVYKVEIPVIGKIAALKRMEPPALLMQLMTPEKLRRMFTAEAVTMAQLRHPNLVDVWDFDEDRGRPFYLMDYFCNNLGVILGESHRYEAASPGGPPGQGGPLHDSGSGGDWMRCTTPASSTGTSSPFNILVTDQDTVKISDFGLSRLRGERPMTALPS